MTESSYADEGDLAEQGTADDEEDLPLGSELDPEADDADVAEQRSEVGTDDEDAYPEG